MNPKSVFNNIVFEIRKVLDKTTEKDFNKLVQEILKSKRIFLSGSGRSGLVIETFAMRLAQLDLNVYVMGESDTPRIKRGDLVIIVSGSGNTKIILEMVKNAKKAKAKIYAITSNKNSKIAKNAKKIIEINAKTKSNKLKSIEPLGSLFEQSVFIYLDSIVLALMKKSGKKEYYLKKSHSKLR